MTSLGGNDDVFAAVALWLAAGEQVALATVTETWGSSPRPAGSHLAVTAGGRIAGSVSGGCVEAAVAEAAMDTLAGGKPRLLAFGVTNERAWEVGLSCGGRFSVFVEKLPPVFAALAAAPRPVVLATHLSGGGHFLLPDAAAPAWLAEAGRAALREDRSRTVTLGEEKWFLRVCAPPLRLVLVGAVHIAQALAAMAVQLGLAVVVIDPRRAFATAERFPRATLRTDWPDQALEALAPDVRTAVVTLTHDPKLDDPALDRALRSAAFYIGSLGSRRTHVARLARLRALGHDEAALARIRGPVGLEIEAVTAPEIALSVLAEIVAVRRGAALAER